MRIVIATGNLVSRSTFLPTLFLSLSSSSCIYFRTPLKPFLNSSPNMKSTPTLSRSLIRAAARPQPLQYRLLSRQVQRISKPNYAIRILPTTRHFSLSPAPSKGLTPGSSDPPAPETEPNDPSHASTLTPADLTDEQYHSEADDYLDILIAELEEKAEDSPEIEVEFSVRYISYLAPPSPTNGLI
jgi:hypothetical protein